MDTMKFDLVTPEAVYFSGQAAQIDIPGSEGEFGVLPGHAPLISALRGGVVTIYGADSQTRRIFVAGGIAEVNSSSCTVLAERVINIEALTRAEAEKNLQKARETLDLAMAEIEKADAQAEVKLAEAVLSALS